MSRHCGFPIVPVSLAALLLLGAAQAIQQLRSADTPLPAPSALSAPQVPPAALILSSSPAPSLAPPAVAQEEEATPVDVMTQDLSRDDALPKVRKAVQDFVRERYPNSRVEGVFTLSLGRDHTLYMAGADTVFHAKQDSEQRQQQQRRTIDVLVRLYTRRNGSGYWRAESLGRDEAAALLLRRSQQHSTR